MIYGTCFFPSFGAAVEYYGPYLGNKPQKPISKSSMRAWHMRYLVWLGRAEAWVRSKLAEQEIHLGKPPLQPGDTCYLDLEEQRYFVKQAENVQRRQCER